MQANIRRNVTKLAMAALFAASTAGAVVATEAANPAQPGATGSGMLASTSLAADAQGYRYYRPGYHRWHGRYWAHRRWRPGYWGPYHRWHPGVWIYF